jgi:hypothetical protein
MLNIGRENPELDLREALAERGTCAISGAHLGASPDRVG